jgi:2-dehydropantoate 2-reductase
MEKLNVLVFGAGAIGTYIGGSLAHDGNNVTFVERPKVVEELLKHGLHLDLTNGRNSVFTIRDPSVAFAPCLEEALKYRPYNIAIFALKSFDTALALDGMKPFADRLPPILCLSNGVDNEPAIAAVLGPDKVIAGTVTSSVGRRKVGDIVLERFRGVGVTDGFPLSLFLTEVLNAAGLNAHLFRRAADMKWSKVLTNLPANATAAILDMNPAEVIAHPGLFHLEMRMLREALAVMSALGLHVVDLPGVSVRALAIGTKLPEFIARSLMQRAVGGGRGGKMPSFHIDLYSGRGRSEVEWLNGAIVHYGQKAGVKTPVNQNLTDTLLALTLNEVPLDMYTHQPMKLLSQNQK